MSNGKNHPNRSLRTMLHRSDFFPVYCSFVFLILISIPASGSFPTVYTILLLFESMMQEFSWKITDAGFLSASVKGTLRYYFKSR